MRLWCCRGDYSTARLALAASWSIIGAVEARTASSGHLRKLRTDLTLTPRSESDALKVCRYVTDQVLNVLSINIAKAGHEPSTVPLGR